MTYTLYIGGFQVDELETEKLSIPLNKKYESLTKPTTYFTDFSKSINIPFTRNNNELFSKIFRCDQVVTNLTIDPRLKIPFMVMHNNAVVMRGYCKVTNIYNSHKNKYYQVNLFSRLGEILNDIKQYTFGKADEAKYHINNPLTTGLMVNRHLVKNSFEMDSHNLDITTKSDLDWFGFAPTYQGKYSDFESGKREVYNGRIDELDYDDDEHYTREFRSYYQQPYVWVDGIFQLVKKQVETTSSTKMILDPSWFCEQNPYWSKAIYTCPTLFNEDSETKKSLKLEKFNYDENHVKKNIYDQSTLSNHHRQILSFSHKEGDTIYNASNKSFNTSVGYPVHFKERIKWWLFASNPDWQLGNGYCKIRKDNPIFFKFTAVDSVTNKEIQGANKIYMLYSGSTNTTTGYDVALDVGITSRNKPSIDARPEDGYGPDKGYFWGGELNVEFDVNTTHPFHIVMDMYCKNNGDPFEYAITSFIPRWDWMWTDLFYTVDYPVGCSKGMTFWVRNVSSSVEQTTHIRTNSEITMDRIWSKEQNIFDMMMSYCKMFHLVWDYDDEEDAITIMTRNRYFSGRTIVDWTDRLDRSQDMIIQPISFDKKYVNFNYEEGAGQRHEYYQNKYERNYGEIKIDTGYDFSDESEDLFEGITPSMICSKQQASYYMNTRYKNSPNFKGYGYKVLPNEYFIDNDSEGSNAGMSGAFYFNNGTYPIDGVLSGKNTNGDYCIVISDDTEYQIKQNSYCWGGSNKVICTKFPAISVYDETGTKAFQFNEPKELYFNRDVVPYNNPTYIYDGFWKKYLDERYSVQNKVVTCYVYLSADDYRRFRFNQFVIIDNVLYVVNAIKDFDITSSSSTKVELMQVYDITAYTDSHLTIPCLFTDRNNITIDSNATTINVYSSSDWSVTSSPLWVNYSKDNTHLYVNAISTSVFARFGYIRLQNSEGLTCTIIVIQKATMGRLTASLNNIMFDSDGGSVTVVFDTNPETISVVSKPEWVDVNFVSMMMNGSNSGFISERRGNVSGMFTATKNLVNLTRRGNVVLSNGSKQITILVAQQGGRFITRTDNPNDEPIILTVGSETQLSLRTNKVLDRGSLSISSGAVDATGMVEIDSTNFKVTPSLKEGKTSGGGQVIVNTLDGEPIVWNYNAGTVTKSHLVKITTDNNGEIEVN